MKSITVSLFFVLTFSLYGQDINNKIILQLSQASLLRVEAGKDINLTSEGSVIIGESLYITGGSPPFAYLWTDEQMNEYNQKSPEVNQTGKYRVIVTDQKNCTAKDSLQVFDYGTGVDLEGLNAGEKIIVDGINSAIKIELMEVKGPLRISLYTMDGKKVYGYSTSFIQNGFTHRIIMESGQNGIFILTLDYNGNHSAYKLFIK